MATPEPNSPHRCPATSPGAAGAAQQRPTHLGQQWWDLVEQFMRLVEPASGFDTAAWLPVFILPLVDAGKQAGMSGIEVTTAPVAYHALVVSAAIRQVGWYRVSSGVPAEQRIGRRLDRADFRPNPTPL
jgi:hypothetical protein